MISRSEGRFVLGVKSGWLKPEQDGRGKGESESESMYV
jgi:alkanesulfonate monooxygenase SsuD/methylene tetrahydromethanopterin reductase-like flavin-dependent oxidoreductase (luciferase family)